MSYVKKNVNMGLLFLIIVLALAIAGLGIYYNQNYNELSAEYTSQLASLQRVTDELLYHKSQLNQTAQVLQTKEEDESVLSSKYSELRSTNEGLERDLTSIRVELQSRTSELAKKTTDLLAAQSTMASQLIEIEQLKSTKSKLQNQIEDLEDDMTTVCGGDTSVCP